MKISNIINIIELLLLLDKKLLNSNNFYLSVS